MRNRSSLLLAVLLIASLPCLAQRPAPQPDPVSITLPATKLAEYVGQYRDSNEPDAITAVVRDGDRLFVEGERSPRTEIKADSPDHFFIPDSVVRFAFTRDASGKVAGLVTTVRGNTGAPLVRFTTNPGDLNHFRDYSRQEVMIPMRDGAKIHTIIFRPKGSETGTPLPFLMQRTPYGVDNSSSNGVNGSKPELAASGYIFVYSDIRGRYKSEGTFVMNRPVVAHTTKNDVDETTDTHDTIDWLLKNIPNNSGRVGVYGVSYSGFLAMMAGIDAHPAVKAISPQAPMTDIWLGDDFFHNGTFRQTYGFDYVQQLEAQKTDVAVQSSEDTYDFYLRNTNFANAAATAHMQDLPTAKIFIAHPEYAQFWKAMAVQTHLTKVEVPTLEVGGWWDQEDMWGPQAEYAALRPHDKKSDPNHEVFLVLGPWNHGGWGGTSRHLGALNFGAAVGDQYRKDIEAPFFERYLKDRGTFNLKDTASFRTGSNEWKRYDIWPPTGPGFKRTHLDLFGTTAAFEAAANTKPITATYVSDPANPIPYRNRPIQPTYGNGSKWRTWLVEDQSFLKNRKDLANFTTVTLDHDVTITGDVTADLFASTTGTDADWIVKLIDVYPDDAPAPMAGFQLMIADEIFRGRYRKSFEQPEAIIPNHVAEYKWSLHGADHTFLKGHKIMVQVQSTWFPLYDRNPQTFVPNIMTAPAEAYKPQTQQIVFSISYPSHLDVTIAQ